jgi:hypothetical protein
MDGNLTEFVCGLNHSFSKSFIFIFSAAAPPLLIHSLARTFLKLYSHIGVTALFLTLVT